LILIHDFLAKKSTITG